MRNTCFIWTCWHPHKLTRQLETHAVLSDSSRTTQVLQYLNRTCVVLRWYCVSNCLLNSQRIQMNYMFLICTLRIQCSQTLNTITQKWIYNIIFKNWHYLTYCNMKVTNFVILWRWFREYTKNKPNLCSLKTILEGATHK